MKKLRKAVSLLLAVVMVMSLCAVQVGAVGATQTGSVTITNASVGETYNLYKMLDLVYDANNSTHYYTVATGWSDFFTTGAGASYVSIDDTTGQVTWTAATTGTGSILQAFAEAALTYATNQSIDPTAYGTATDTTLTITGVDYGYYVIDSSLGTLFTVDSVTSSVEVEDKNSDPTVKKTVQEDVTEEYGSSNTADVGETVNFRLEIASGYSTSNLTVHDTLATGFTLDADSFSIKIGASLASADNTVDSKYYTLTTTGLTDGCSFEIVFTDEFTSDILTSSQLIIIEYKATVNSDATIGSTGNTNTVYLSYGNATKSTSAETITYVYELYVYKYTIDTSDNSEEPLEGATFVLYRTVGTTNYYVVLNSNGILSSETTDISNATKLTTSSTGLIYFGGLDAGTYYLLETEAPTNYSVLPAAVTIEIANDGTISGSATATVGGTDYTAIKVYNGSSAEMPSTGGVGVTVFYVVGGMMVVLALGVLGWSKRRAKADR